jgi:hypothetical protein
LTHLTRSVIVDGRYLLFQVYFLSGKTSSPLPSIILLAHYPTFKIFPLTCLFLLWRLQAVTSDSEVEDGLSDCETVFACPGYDDDRSTFDNDIDVADLDRARAFDNVHDLDMHEPGD